jgi:nucleotide-binding universal stress UspA family protein
VTVKAAERFRRLVVAVEPETDAGALEATALLVRVWQVRVEGVFVEDMNLFRWASLPRCWAVGALTARELPVTPAHMERHFRRQGERARTRLEAAVAHARDRLGFRTIRGSVPEGLMGLLEDVDLLLVGRGRPGRPGALGSTARALLTHGKTPLLLIPHRFRRGGSVAAMIRSGSDPEPLRSAAEVLARAWGGRLVLFMDPAGDEAPGTPRSGEEPGSRPPLSPPGNPADVAAALQRLGVGTVVLHREDPLLVGEDLDAFASRFPGAILVLGS